MWCMCMCVCVCVYACVCGVCGVWNEEHRGKRSIMLNFKKFGIVTTMFGDCNNDNNSFHNCIPGTV